MMKIRTFITLILALLSPIAFVQTASGQTNAETVIVEHIKIHSPSLENNLSGETANRNVIVYLPHDYKTNPKKRYPVVYGLHGYNMTSDAFEGLLQAPRTINEAYNKNAPQSASEMIVVLPDTQTRFKGSMYSSSVTIGDWEGFIADDLVAYIDTHYRTLATRESRGLFGHSMGGYGATRIGMKRPDVFGAIYIMSPCCLSARFPPSTETLAKLSALSQTPADQLDIENMDFMSRATLAVAAAWSPNPKRPPLYLDLPTPDGKDTDGVVSRWAANAPLIMFDQYVFNLKKYKAIAIDVGDQDGLMADSKVLYEKMVANGVAASFEIYEGDHGNHVASQFQNKVLPFFAKTLRFTPVDAPH